MQSYAELLSAAQADPADADYHALRMAYARSDAYQPYTNDSENLDRLRTALKNADWQTALGAVDKLLAFNYLDIETHMAADYVHTQQDNSARAQYHRAFARGLITAILATGDGRGYDTAFIVLCVAEEYTVLRVLGLAPGRQALMRHEGHTFDVFDVRHPASGAAQVYFNIDLPHGWLSTHMGSRD